MSQIPRVPIPILDEDRRREPAAFPGPRAPETQPAKRSKRAKAAAAPQVEMQPAEGPDLAAGAERYYKTAAQEALRQAREVPGVSADAEAAVRKVMQPSAGEVRAEGDTAFASDWLRRHLSNAGPTNREIAAALARAAGRHADAIGSAAPEMLRFIAEIHGSPDYSAMTAQNFLTSSDQMSRERRAERLAEQEREYERAVGVVTNAFKFTSDLIDNGVDTAEAVRGLKDTSEQVVRPFRGTPYESSLRHLTSAAMQQSSLYGVAVSRAFGNTRALGKISDVLTQEGARGLNGVVRTQQARGRGYSAVVGPEAFGSLDALRAHVKRGLSSKSPFQVMDELLNTADLVQGEHIRAVIAGKKTPEDLLQAKVGFDPDTALGEAQAVLDALTDAFLSAQAEAPDAMTPAQFQAMRGTLERFVGNLNVRQNQLTTFNVINEMAALVGDVGMQRRLAGMATGERFPDAAAMSLYGQASQKALKPVFDAIGRLTPVERRLFYLLYHADRQAGLAHLGAAADDPRGYAGFGEVSDVDGGTRDAAVRPRATPAASASE